MGKLLGKPATLLYLKNSILMWNGRNWIARKVGLHVKWIVLKNVIYLQVQNIIK